MQQLKITKGYHFRIEGQPPATLERLDPPDHLALLPERIPFFKPRLLVDEGQTVALGEPLCADKHQPHLQLPAPAGGTVRRIVYGPRRVMQAIVIERDRRDEPQQSIEPLGEEQLAQIARPQLVDRILAGGGWCFFRELPLRNLPATQTIPPLILVGLAADEPFQPQPAVYLKGSSHLLAYGIAVLQRLCGNVIVFGHSADHEVQTLAGPWLTHRVTGDYPAADPGTVLYRLKRSPADNRAWFIDGQDLLGLARLLLHGRFDGERIVAVGGSRAVRPRHVLTRLGAPLAHLAGSAPPAAARWVVGGLLRGYHAATHGYLGLMERSLTLLPSDDEAEFLELFRPGYAKPSYSRTFLSALNRRPLVYDTKLHGEPRACIACLHCVAVCPVDILPHMTYKAILVEEVEEYLAHGLLDCVECGLCSYVCPSKIELTATFKTAKAAYAKEMGGTSAER